MGNKWIKKEVKTFDQLDKDSLKELSHGSWFPGLVNDYTGIYSPCHTE